jgi:hypothetical protein
LYILLQHPDIPLSSAILKLLQASFYPMTHRAKRSPIIYRGVPTREMCDQAGISSDYLKSIRIRGLLKKGIHYYSLPNSERIVWIVDLVRDYLVNGDSPAHDRAIERYLESLPSSASYSPKSGS